MCKDIFAAAFERKIKVPPPFLLILHIFFLKMDRLAGLLPIVLTGDNTSL
jgi:hypothetical protein